MTVGDGMGLDWSTLWIVVVPPIAGGIIGYFTNDLAITMLFRPYRAYRIGPNVLPFTPGLIPRNQGRLAQRISEAIMSSLLTPEELQAIAQRLLHTERVESVILWFLQLALDQVKGDKEQKTAKILSHILHDFANVSLPRVMTALARQEDFLQAQLDQIFDQVLLELQLQEEQARQLTDWVIEAVLPPDKVRLALINFLTDRNIAILDQNLREKSSGTYWLLANLVGARSALHNWRTFCIEERDACNVLLTELLIALKIRQRLTEWLTSLSLQNLPVRTVRQLRQTFRYNVRDYIQAKGLDLLEGLNETLNWDETATMLVQQLRSSTAVETSLTPVSKELALILERYLERDLELMVAQVIPILNLDQVIIDRVNRTPPAALETAIRGIVKSELQGIVVLGGILGLIIGSLQSVFLLLQSFHPPP